MTPKFGVGNNRVPPEIQRKVSVIAYWMDKENKPTFGFDCTCEQSLDIKWGEKVKCSHCGRMWEIKAIAVSEPKN